MEVESDVSLPDLTIGHARRLLDPSAARSHLAVDRKRLLITIVVIANVGQPPPAVTTDDSRGRLSHKKGICLVCFFALPIFAPP